MGLALMSGNPTTSDSYFQQRNRKRCHSFREGADSKQDFDLTSSQGAQQGCMLEQILYC